MHPRLAGSPQHFFAAFIVAALVAWYAPRFTDASEWVIAALAIGAAMTGEVLVEVVEYPLRYADDPNLTAYYDTVADLASSLVGSAAGAAGGIAIRRRLAGP